MMFEDGLLRVMEFAVAVSVNRGFSFDYGGCANICVIVLSYCHFIIQLICAMIRF